MLQRALFSRGAARTVEASPVEEAYAWVAYVTLAVKTNHPELRLAQAWQKSNVELAACKTLASPCFLPNASKSL